MARLSIDGAHSTEALQRRVRVLAEERKIPPADFAKLMRKRISTMAIMEFGKKHNINLAPGRRSKGTCQHGARAPQSSRRPSCREAGDRGTGGLCMTRPNDIEDLKREVERLQDAKRRALAIADERSKENAALRNMNAALLEEIERLRVRLAECHRS